MTTMTLAGMLPGTPIASLGELKNLPAHSVVLCRTHVQPYFRTAWTLTIMDSETRYWSSASWRAHPSDEELFAAAKETIVVLYKPFEQFGIGLLNAAGWIEDQTKVVVYPGLQDAKGDIGRRAAKDPMAAILHRIDPGPWIVHEGN